MSRLGEDVVAAAFRAACHDEIAALKPGNVHIHAPGHGMDVGHFERAAEAAAPWMATAGIGLGARIRHAVEASMAAAGCNTNLGIVLLCAPLAAAALIETEGSLEARTAIVLEQTTHADAIEIYAAIRLANPGGLGRSPAEDVASPPTVPLLQAMSLAAERDRIAYAYVTGFEEVFRVGLPTLALARGSTGDPTSAITALHLALLAQHIDSHIARKHGVPAALTVMREAALLLPMMQGPPTPATTAALLAFDRSLKQRGLNPGTTADFVVATLFAARLEAEMATRTAL